MTDQPAIFSDDQIEFLRDNFAPKPEGATVRHDFYYEPVPVEIDWLKLEKLLSGVDFACESPELHV